MRNRRARRRDLAAAWGLLWVLLSATGAAAVDAGEAGCTAGTAASIVARIQSRYEKVSDLEARFEQTSRSVVMGASAAAEASVSRGSVLFAKPGKMRWVYEQPEPSLVVSDGVHLWIHDVAGKQASRMSVTRGYLAGAALQFLMGEGKLESEFSITLRECREGQVELDLLPKRSASYERLGLRADLETGQIVATTIVDLFGNTTRVVFEDLRFDRKPAASSFRFEAPAGVDVIDLDEAR